MQTSVRPPQDFAPTLRYRREEITTKFTREPVDADDTVPVDLYSRPYERLEIQRAPDAMCITASRNLVAPEVTRRPVAPPPRREFRLALAISILCMTFALGVGIAFLAL
jgi:hypothetical protein